MKKLIKKFALAAAATVLLTGLAACSKADSGSGSSSASSSGSSSTASSTDENKEIILGICAGPYGDLFTDAIYPTLEEKGYTLKIVEFSDYVQPNHALANGETNVNLFQHSNYLKKFSEDNKLDLTMLTEVPTVGMGVYSDKLKSLDELADGAVVTVPDDASNLARALRVLQAAGLIKLNPGVDPASATEKDVAENPKNLEFVLTEAPQLPRTLDSADIAVVNGNFATSAGLDPANALYNEVLVDGYLNVVAVRTEDKDSQLAKDIIDAVHSDAFRSVIDASGSGYEAFQKPQSYND